MRSPHTLYWKEQKQARRQQTPAKKWDWTMLNQLNRCPKEFQMAWLMAQKRLRSPSQHRREARIKQKMSAGRKKKKKKYNLANRKLKTGFGDDPDNTIGYGKRLFKKKKKVHWSLAASTRLKNMGLMCYGKLLCSGKWGWARKQQTSSLCRVWLPCCCRTDESGRKPEGHDGHKHVLKASSLKISNEKWQK